MHTGKEQTMKRELTELLQKGHQVEKAFIATLSDEERNADGTFESLVSQGYHCAQCLLAKASR